MYPRLIEPTTSIERLLLPSDLNPTRMRDVLGRVKVAIHQNIYDADFEYGTQPLRWDFLTLGGGSVTHLPGEGGVRMRVGTASGDLVIRQSRPYHRYQPGKSMFMSTAIFFGTALANQINRAGFFDDSNGVFFEQIGATPANPSGIGVVTRSDAGGILFDTRVPLESFSNAALALTLNWSNIQMIFIEYAWYGAGAVRWGIMLNGEPHILHQIGYGNRPGQTRAWSRTGNLPVRYEQRNLGVTTAVNDMTHYGVSVCVEGGIDEQRGFTYAYSTLPAVPRRAVAGGATRFPLMSVRGRLMGTQEFTQAGGAITSGSAGGMNVAGTPFSVNQFQGRMLAYVVAGATFTARIASNTTSALLLVDIITGGGLAVAPVAGGAYTIGQINRGQLLPRRLQVTSDQLCTVELIVSTPTLPGQPGPVVLTGSNFVALASLGSTNSFAERDVAATAMTGGEVVYAMTLPANQPIDQTIDSLFPMVNSIRGNATDVLTVAITTQAGVAANVSAQIIGQEAMS